QQTTVLKKLQQLWMFVTPAPRVYLSPELPFLCSDYPHLNVLVLISPRSFNRSIENITEFNRPVVATAKQICRRDSGQRTNFMLDWRSAVEEESFNKIK